MTDKREKMKREYLAELDKLYLELEKAATIEECGEIRIKLGKLDNEIEKKVTLDVFRELMEMSHRLDVAIDRKIEFLGGPKAPMF